MKLLLDENLSRRLAARLADLFPEIIHASDCALLQSADSRVWEYARSHGYTIVTTDADFFDLVTASGPPPQVVWLRRWKYRTRDVEALLRRESIRIATFCGNPELGVLVLDYRGPATSSRPS